MTVAGPFAVYAAHLLLYGFRRLNSPFLPVNVVDVGVAVLQKGLGKEML